MSTTPKITKEMILKASLDLLIAEGYSAVNIKAIAKKLHCSTHPISWHFKNMEGLRIALLDAALAYVNKNYRLSASNAFLSSYLIGKAHLDIAINTPHLFRYLYLGECGIKLTSDTLLIPNPKEYEHPIYEISEYLNISFDQALYITQIIKFFTHGLASTIATNTFTYSPEDTYSLLSNTVYHLLSSVGVAEDVAKILAVNPFDIIDNNIINNTPQS